MSLPLNYFESDMDRDFYLAMRKELDPLFLEDRINRANNINVEPDTAGVDFYFLSTFINDAMYHDFTLIEQDFLKNCREDIEAFNNYAWYDETIVGINDPITITYNNVLRLIYNGAKMGNTYCISLMQNLYKTYYKREYKQVKNFKNIRTNDIFSIAKDDPDNDRQASMCRILAICPFFNIKLDRDTTVHFKTFEKRKDIFFANINKKIIPDFEISKDIWEESIQEIEEVAHKFKDDSKAYKGFSKAISFTNACYQYFGFAKNYTITCIDNFEGVKKSMIETLAILKKIYPNEEYSADEIAIFSNVFNLVNAITDVAVDFDSEIGALLGDTIDEEEFEDALFRPIVKKAETKDVQIQSTKEETFTELDNVSLEDYKSEIKELRARLHQKEEDYRNLYDKNKLLRSEVKQLSAEVAANEANKNELIALRDFVYNSTENTEPTTGISLEEMKAFLAAKDIVIIGGHENWHNKLKQLFSSWTFIRVNDVVTVEPTIVDGRDAIYFYTDYLSHKEYRKFMSVIRKKELKIGYINNVNVEKNISQIYNNFEN